MGERELSPVGSTPQIPSKAKKQSGQTQEPGTQSKISVSGSDFLIRDIACCFQELFKQKAELEEPEQQ